MDESQQSDGYNTHLLSLSVHTHSVQARVRDMLWCNVRNIGFGSSTYLHASLSPWKSPFSCQSSK